MSPKRSTDESPTDRLPNWNFAFRHRSRVEAFRQGLRELGYIEGQNIAIEFRYAEGKQDRYPALAAELVHLNVDLIVVTGGSAMIRAAKNATKMIPIVLEKSIITDTELKQMLLEERPVYQRILNPTTQ